MRTANFRSDGEALVWSLSVICETKLGRDMAFDARFEDWSVEVDDIEDGHHIINPQLRILILPRFAPSALALARSQNDRTKFLLEMARGLRSIWHDMTGVRENAELTVDDQILWERLRRMDQDLCALKMAWDLREQGMGGIWRHMIETANRVTTPCERRLAMSLSMVGAFDSHRQPNPAGRWTLPLPARARSASAPRTPEGSAAR